MNALLFALCIFAMSLPSYAADLGKVSVVYEGSIGPNNPLRNEKDYIKRAYKAGVVGGDHWPTEISPKLRNFHIEATGSDASGFGWMMYQTLGDDSSYLLIVGAPKSRYVRAKYSVREHHQMSGMFIFHVEFEEVQITPTPEKVSTDL